MGENLRHSYEESCKVLQGLGLLEGNRIPPQPQRQPRHDDDEPGVSIFRISVEKVSLNNLSLARTFFGRSEIRSVSFKGTDLTESILCWNDFIEVDFADADLSRCDLRAANFRNVKFVRSNLTAAELRNASFEQCDFTDANMDGTKLTRMQGWKLKLSEQQRKGIDWHWSGADQPPGG